MRKDGYAGFRETLAKLTAMVATQRAMCVADPLPFLDRAYRQMASMHRAMLEVEAALNDPIETYEAAAACGVPVDYYKGDTEKLHKARAALAEYLRG